MYTIEKCMDLGLLEQLTEEDARHIEEIVVNYYQLKSLESGVDELELISMLFVEGLSLIEISSRIGLSTRQIRRRKDKYIDYFVKIIDKYIKENEIFTKRT